MREGGRLLDRARLWEGGLGIIARAGRSTHAVSVTLALALQDQSSSSEPAWPLQLGRQPRLLADWLQGGVQPPMGVQAGLVGLLGLAPPVSLRLPLLGLPQVAAAEGGAGVLRRGRGAGGQLVQAEAVEGGVLLLAVQLRVVGRVLGAGREGRPAGAVAGGGEWPGHAPQGGHGLEGAAQGAV